MRTYPSLRTCRISFFGSRGCDRLEPTSSSISDGRRCTPSSGGAGCPTRARSRGSLSASRRRARPTRCARASRSPRRACASATAARRGRRRTRSSRPGCTSRRSGCSTGPSSRARGPPRPAWAAARRAARRGRAPRRGARVLPARHARGPGPPQLRGGRRLGRRAPRARAVARRGQADVLPELQPDAHDEDDDAPLLDLRQVRLALRPPLRVARHVRRRAQLLVVLRPAHARGRHDDAPPRGGRPRRARARARLGAARARGGAASGSTAPTTAAAARRRRRSRSAARRARRGGGSSTSRSCRWRRCSRSTCGSREGLTTIAFLKARWAAADASAVDKAQLEASAGATSRRGRTSGGARRARPAARAGRRSGGRERRARGAGHDDARRAQAAASSQRLGGRDR